MHLDALLARFPLAPLGGKDAPGPVVQPEPSCRYHGTERMTPSKYGAHRWVCSVKLPGGAWCNQPWPKKGEGHGPPP